MFNHELTSDTLKCVKTNNVNELNNLKLNYNQSNYETYDCDEENSDNYIGLSKIVSIQTLNSNIIAYFSFIIIVHHVLKI